jgi:diguanylate cyclase (GGDEF)-like protein
VPADTLIVRHLSTNRWAAAALLTLTAMFGLVAVGYTFDLGGGMRHVLNVWVYNNVMLAAGAICLARGVTVREERLAWILLGAALLAWGTGSTVWQFTVANLAHQPFPSYADIGFLSVYPLAYCAIVLLLRSRAGPLRLSLWLDGVIGGLAVAAVGSSFVFKAVLDGLGGSPAAVATTLAYPLADLTLIGAVVWALALTGWRPSRAWGLIGAGLLVFSVSDCLYLYQTATDTYTNGSPTDLGWIAGGLLLAWAAWQPRGDNARPVAEGWPMLLAPLGFGMLGLGLLVYDHFHPLDALSLSLSSLTILAVIARLGFMHAENIRMLTDSSEDARTDVLTGLGNRRGMIADLESLLEDGTANAIVALFDLNGFKEYNDAFGHLAGDALLSRLGVRLSGFVSGQGNAYRMGGDEFCIVLDADGGSDTSGIAAAARTLSEHGDGFVITTAFGAVRVPAEATTPTDALRIADQRMYAQKACGRKSATEQSSGVLLSALSERDPELSEHAANVAARAEAVALKLGLGLEEVARVRLAAALHDVGKMAIPNEILADPGPRNEDELAFLRRHTLIGERILHAAPALSHIASVVRSSGERFDGTGYPDGLAGELIPLASRIVSVCDAFETFMAARAYAGQLEIAAAVESLRRRAGTEFDPVVVEALEMVVADEAAPSLMLVS